MIQRDRPAGTRAHGRAAVRALRCGHASDRRTAPGPPSSAGCVPSVYDRPYPVAPVELPRDDAAHAAPIEWWYWVGHLETADGRELAFQLTFFEAYAPPQLRLLGIPSNLLLEKGIVGHAAAADLGAGRHGMAQRFDAYYEGGASTERLDVFVGDWRVTRAEDGVSHALAFTVDGYAFDLVLTPTKPASLHGDPPGIQSMGAGGVSYYVSHTRMDVRGEVRGRCAFPAACAPDAGGRPGLVRPPVGRLPRRRAHWLGLVRAAARRRGRGHALPDPRRDRRVRGVGGQLRDGGRAHASASRPRTSRSSRPGRAGPARTPAPCTRRAGAWWCPRTASTSGWPRASPIRRWTRAPPRRSSTGKARSR